MMVKKKLTGLWKEKMEKKKAETVVVTTIFLLVIFIGVTAVWDVIRIGKIIRRVTAPYLEQMEKIEDFTLLTDQGMVYYKRTFVDGQLTYKMLSEMKQGEEKIVINRYYNPYTLWKNLRFWRITHLRAERLSGHKMYVLRVRNLSKIMGSSKGNRVPGELWVDPRDWTLRRIEIWTDLLGKKELSKTTISLKDYRRVNGLYIPFLTEIAMPPVLTPEDDRGLRRKMKEIREGLEGMSQKRKEAVEPLVKTYLETIEGLLSGKTFFTRVLAVRVNTGLPDTLFEEEK